NDRLLRFHAAPLPDTLVAPGRWNGALVLDADHDERADVVLVGPSQAPLLLLSQFASDATGVRRGFHSGPCTSPPLLQAQAVDLDLDGWTDVVGLSEQGVPVFLDNKGGRLEHAPQALGADTEWPQDVRGVTVVDVDGDGFPDLLIWSEATGLQLHVNQGNG